MKTLPHILLSWTRFHAIRCVKERRTWIPSRNVATSASTASTKSFEELGLDRRIIQALRTAFPSVRHPTETQSKFIPAILSGKDVLLKDETGSGKSFGLILALLSQPRVLAKQENSTATAHAITSMAIVPHRELAYQLLHWVQRVVAASQGASLPAPGTAQVLVRDNMQHLETGLQMLRANPPHILIGTPQALWDVWNHEPDVLQIPRLRSVVVDEVDYLVETVPKKNPDKSFYKAYVKAQKKLQAHPGVTRQLLDVIFAKRKEVNEARRDEPGIVQYRRRTGAGEESEQARMPPQLILSSATLRSHLSNYLFDESGWLDKDNLLKVKGSAHATTTPYATAQPQIPEEHTGLGGEGVLHSVLVVSNDRVKNIEGAVPCDTPDIGEHEALDPHKLFGSSTEEEPPAVDRSLAEKYAGTPSPFNPNVLEAIATAFALDVPLVALLVLPSSASIQRAVYELQELGVNAQRLDLLSEDKGKAHLLQGRGADGRNPTLLVSTLASTRGLDLPELTHVFILGVPEGPKVSTRSVNAYVHIAGRVGRFRRGGKVITVVEGGQGPITEEKSIRLILERLSVIAVRLGQFD